MSSKIVSIKIENIGNKNMCTLTLNVINEYGQLAYEEDDYFAWIFVNVNIK